MAAKFITVVIAVSLGLLCVPATTPVNRQETQEQQEQPQSAKPDVRKKSDETALYMQAKLASSQRVLEGLVTENFKMISDGARQLKKISEASHWPTTIDEIYQHHSVAFRMQCDKLVAQADQQELQAAHYTYLHMSTTCIDCHNYVRGRFRVESRQPGGPVQLIPTQWDGPVKKKRPDPPQPDDRRKDPDTN